jgi:hypothetical protein
MSEGGGQAVVFTLSGLPNFKLYHYTDTGGSTTLKDIYSDEDLQTTMAQPAIADANGVIQFWGHGDYRFLIKDSTDVEKYDWDVFHVSQGQSVILNYDTSLGAANAANKGMLKGKIDGSSVVRALAMSSGTVWVNIAAYDDNGNQIIDSVITKSIPEYNVKHSDWGAKGDGTTDDTAAVQLAIDDISTAGSGVLFFPKGIYVINGTLDIDNCSIKIYGDGEGQTILLQKTSPSGVMVDYDTTDILDVFIIDDLTIQTEIGSVTSGDHVLDLAWPSESGNNFSSNCNINISIVPTNATKATSGFDTYVKLTNAKKPILTDCEFRGHSGGTMEGSAVSLEGYTNDTTLRNCKMTYLAKGVVTVDNIDVVKLIDCDIDECTQGIDNTVAADIRLISTKMATSDDGLTSSATMTNLEVDNCTITKLASSTEDWTGILVDAVDYMIGGGKITDAGSSSGTDIGISITTGTVGIVENVLIDNIRTDGIKVAAGITNFDLKGNIINTAVTGINVVAGASDDYMIVGNNLEGCTTGLTDDGTGTNKIVTDNLNGGSASTETQQIETATLTTTDATQTTIWSTVLDATSVYSIEAHVVGQNSATTVIVSGHVSGEFYRVAGNAVIGNQAQLSYFETDAISNIIFAVDTTSIALQVIGKGGTTVDWKASVIVLKKS